MSETDWKLHSSKLNTATIASAFKSPSEFQLELVEFMKQECSTNRDKIAVEAGCEQATTSLLLEGFSKKIALDLNPDIIDKLRQFLSEYSVEGVQALHGDMFNMPLDDSTVDLVHNAGVLEHFDFNLRVQALKEYKRVLKDDGTIIIAIPNHFTFPYRSAYLFHYYLLMRLFWKWPAEFKIRNFDREADAAGLKVVKETDLAFATAFKFWRPFHFVGKLMHVSSKFLNYEGYLKVFVLKQKKLVKMHVQDNNV